MTRTRPRKPTKILLHIAGACVAVAVLGGATSTESYWSERKANLERLRAEHDAAQSDVDRLELEVREARRALTATRLDLAERQAQVWDQDMMDRARRNDARHAALDETLAALDGAETGSDKETPEPTKKAKRKKKPKKKSKRTKESPSGERKPKSDSPGADGDSSSFAPAKKPRKNKIVLDGSDDPLG